MLSKIDLEICVRTVAELGSDQAEEVQTSLAWVIRNRIEGLRIATWERPVHRTLLDVWMAKRGISNNALAVAFGCDGHTVSYWRLGQALPDLVYAFMIERYTAGGVPAAYWIGSQIGRTLWNERMKNAKGFR